MSIEEWLVKINESSSQQFRIRRAATLAPLGEKASLDHSIGQLSPGRRQQPRGLRHLPFSKETFVQICEKFQVHRSIVRSVARSDVPSITCDRVDLKGPALGIVPTHAYSDQIFTNHDFFDKFTIAEHPIRGILTWPYQQLTILNVA